MHFLRRFIIALGFLCVPFFTFSALPKPKNLCFRATIDNKNVLVHVPFDQQADFLNGALLQSIKTKHYYAWDPETSFSNKRLALIKIKHPDCAQKIITVHISVDPMYI